MATKIDCKVYIACKMSGRDRLEMVNRAIRVCDIFKEFGLTPISPVVEEQVKAEEGKLINSDKVKLSGFWQRDKEIIMKEAHVIFLDHAEMKSFGMEREMGFARYCLWKPTVLHVAPGTVVSVAQWEDDKVFTSVHEAAKYIAETWGTRDQRFRWRLAMLKRTIPTWIKRQWWQFR